MPLLVEDEPVGVLYVSMKLPRIVDLEAKIFAIIDVYDSLTSDRPYREAWSKEKTINHIREQSGKHFNPQVVEVFLNTITDNSNQKESE